MSKVKCKQCHNDNVVMVDHQPLCLDADWLECMQFDNELYAGMKCKDCNIIFTQVFTLTPKVYES